LLFVAISDILVVYNADNGEAITKPVKTCKNYFINKPNNQLIV